MPKTSFNNLLMRMLDTVGDGTGNINANVDGSVTPVVFKYVPPAGRLTFIHGLVVHVEDAGVFQPSNYGSGIDIVNGMGIHIRKKKDDSVVFDMLDGFPLLSNCRWAALPCEVILHEFGTKTNSIRGLAVRCDVDTDGGTLIVNDDEYFCVVINDDLTGLISHFFKIHGTYHD